MDFGTIIIGLVVFLVFLCIVGLFTTLSTRIESSPNGRRSGATASSGGGSDGGFIYTDGGDFSGCDGGGDGGGGGGD